MAEADDTRPTPAEVNAEGNAARLARINAISTGVDGRRARDLDDVEGEEVTGRFQGGELDQSPEAREAAAAQEDALAAQALEEAAVAAAAEEAEARRLQEEGGGEGAARTDDAGGAAGGEGGTSDEGDERVIDGVRYYATAVNGEIKWLTLRELREGVATGIATEETLQAARDALQRATEAALTPKAAPAEELTDEQLREVILAAGMGDEEAVKKLASAIRGRPAGPDESTVTRLVSQRIATQRAVDTAERDQADFLDNEVLAPIFRQRLAAFAQSKPKTPIPAAYKAVGDEMRKDFAPMLTRAGGGGNGGRPPGIVPGSKADRKRTLVTAPHGAARTATGAEAEREPSVSSVIDTIAKGRGQERAIRPDQGRR